MPSISALPSRAFQEPTQEPCPPAQLGPQTISHNAYYVKQDSGGLGLVGSPAALVAGMEAAWVQVRTDKEP